jgi:tetratricopeptide (TPR) repeat protein
MYRTVSFLLTFGLCVQASAGLFAQGASSGQSETALIQQAQTEIRANQQAQAANLFRQVLRIDPANVEAHVNLGVIDFYHGDCAGASGELRAALEKAPELVKARALLAVCERRLGSPDAAAHLQQSFTALNDADPKLRGQIGMELADSYYQRGDLLRTAQVLQTLSDALPDNIDILFFEQRVYAELADGTLNKLALLAPQSARMEQLIAERLINAGDLPHAVIHYRKAIALNPALPGMHFELAESLMENAPNDAATQKEALAELADAQRVDGDSSRVESQLGRIALLQSDLVRAQVAYQKAFALSPNDSAAQIGMADVMQQENKPEEAARYLRQAVAVDPMNAQAHYKLSLLDRRLHLDAEQKEQLRLFLDIRATQDKVKVLYREMNPQGTPAAESPAIEAKP